MKGGRYLRNESEGFPLTVTHMCTPPHTHTHTQTYRGDVGEYKVPALMAETKYLKERPFLPPLAQVVWA